MILPNLSLSQISLNDYPKYIEIDSIKLIAITPSQMDSISIKLINEKRVSICDSLVNIQKKELQLKDTLLANYNSFIQFYKERDKLQSDIRINQKEAIDDLKKQLKKETTKSKINKILNYIGYPFVAIGSAIGTYFIIKKL